MLIVLGHNPIRFQHALVRIGRSQGVFLLRDRNQCYCFVNKLLFGVHIGFWEYLDRLRATFDKVDFTWEQSFGFGRAEMSFMDIWGSGNLDGDGALNAMSLRSQELVERVWESLKNVSSADGSEQEHWDICVDIEWIFALERVALFSGLTLPDVEEFDKVSKIWLQAWKDNSGSLLEPELLLERENILAETLADLALICEKYEKRRVA